ncbi:MAG: hypothetical protein IT179_16080 [Acidobacteria bacterium]|nr:hypothetical protein [Acidobacteriota bacterium]
MTLEIELDRDPYTTQIRCPADGRDVLLRGFINRMEATLVVADGVGEHTPRVPRPGRHRSASSLNTVEVYPCRRAHRNAELRAKRGSGFAFDPSPAA